MSTEKKERKVIKIGTHGRTNTNTYNRAPLAYAEGSGEKPKETLQQKDKQEWKARKVKRQARKDRARAAGKRAGVKIGRWQGSVAYAKDGSKNCITVGSPEIANGYQVVSGGDQ